MKILGVDPGVTGALAILDGNGSGWDVLLVDDLPTHLIGTAGKRSTRPELDLHTLHSMIAAHGPLDHAYVERVSSRPGEGVTGAFRFGMAYGGILGVISAMGVPYSLVGPKDWQRRAGCGPAPDAARQRAVQLFPGTAELLSRKKDCHRADSLLLARFGAANGTANNGIMKGD